MEGFLGTRALLWADLSLVLTWALAVAALVGWRLARRRGFPRHCRLMTVATLLNWLPALVVMLPPWVALATLGTRTFTNSRLFVPLMHGAAGISAQLLMTYTVVRMNWLKRLPPRRIRYLMWVTLIMWLLAVLGGTGVYFLLYVG